MLGQSYRTPIVLGFIAASLAVIICTGFIRPAVASNAPASDSAGDRADGLGAEDTSSWKRNTNVNRAQQAKRRARSVRRRSIRRSRSTRRSRRARSVPASTNNEILVSFASGTSVQVVEQVAAAFGLSVVSSANITLLDSRVVKLTAPSSGSGRILEQIAADDRVIAAQLNFIYRTAEGVAGQYAVQKLKLNLAREIGNGSGVSLAVLDTGVNPDHPAFEGQKINHFDALGQKLSRRDTHGTAVSSVIVSRSGIDGVAPGASLLSARTFSYSRRHKKALGETFHLLRGLDWAMANGARVLNLSFTGPRDPLLHAALTASVARGAVAVGAAGNLGPKAPPAYPAAYEEVIAVTATDRRNRLYRRSNRGDYVHIAAPGVSILSATGKSGYRFRSGTSMAAAFVSGTVALLLQKSPDLTPDQIRNALGSSARDLGRAGRDPKFGHGLLDILEASSASLKLQ